MGAVILKEAIRKEIQQSFENLECLAMAECTVQIDIIEEDDWDDFGWDS